MLGSLFILLAIAQAPAAPPAAANPAPVLSTQINADWLIRNCDRLVVARIASVREFDRKPGTLALLGTPKIRIAQLEIVSAPFGSKTEKLLVRIPEGTSPPELAVWPLGHNLLEVGDDWEGFGRLAQTLHADPLWMPWTSLEGPWPVHDSANGQEVCVPDRMFGQTQDSSFAVIKPPARWVPVRELESVITTELARISPRLEADIGGSGGGRWIVEIDGSGNGTFDSGMYFESLESLESHEPQRFQWSEAQRAAWNERLAESKFAAMPHQVGAADRFCSSVLSLSRVTNEGRRTTHYYGSGLRDGAAPEWGPRFESLWAALREQLPKEAR